MTDFWSSHQNEAFQARFLKTKPETRKRIRVQGALFPGIPFKGISGVFQGTLLVVTFYK
jgi:hypothetical protein